MHLNQKEKAFFDSMAPQNQSKAEISSEELDKLECSQNWSFQFGQEFVVTREMLEKEDSFWGKNIFFKYVGIEESYLKNKTVFVACGGSGREAWHILKAGASRCIVADIGEYVYKLNELLKDHTDHLLLVRCDVTNLPIRDAVADIAICDHALQHIPDYKRAYDNLVKVAKRNSDLSVCVYSHENNFLMTKIVEPSKKILRLIPLKLLSFLSLAPALGLYLFHLMEMLIIKLFPSKKLQELLPYFDLLACWYKNGFRKFWEACFDLLQAPVSRHFRREEILALSNAKGLALKKIEMINKTMWTMVVTKN